jgi:uncharacterized protein YecT (DUF1311 family)
VTRFSASRRAILALLVVASLTSAACSPAGAGEGQRAPAKDNSEVRTRAAPTEDLGRYVVTNVLTDPALDNMQQRYFHNDPRLVGRIVAIEPNQLSIDSGLPCTQVGRRWTQHTLAELLQARNQRRNDAAARTPTPDDYRLTPAPSGPIPMVEYQCSGPDRASAGGIPGKEWSETTGWALSNKRRALLWDGEVILVLQPLAPAKPQPSFACSKARTTTERAICGDPSLANWDRSVAAAYTMNLEGKDGGADWAPTENPAELQQSHRRWLGERDRCGADRDCLLDKMFTQTDALMRRQY